MLQRSILLNIYTISCKYHDTTPEIPNPHHLHVDFIQFLRLLDFKLLNSIIMWKRNVLVSIYVSTICGISMNNKNGNTHFYEICCISFEWVSLFPLTNHKEMQVVPQQQMEEVNECNEQVIFWNLC
jgi:hypothetical protein